MSGALGRDFTLGRARSSTPPPAPQPHGKNARISFTLDGTPFNASLILNKVKVTRERETTPDDGLGDTDARFLTGSKQRSLEFEGHFDGALDLGGEIDALAAFDFEPIPGEHETGYGRMIAQLDTHSKQDGLAAISGRIEVED